MITLKNLDVFIPRNQDVFSLRNLGTNANIPKFLNSLDKKRKKEKIYAPINIIHRIILRNSGTKEG